MARIPAATWRRIATAVKKTETGDRKNLDFNPGGGLSVPLPDGGILLAMVSAEIEPNAWGKFRFTQGGKGSETAYGAEFDGYYRNEDEEASALPENELCLVIWIASSDASEPGWELFPLRCLG